MKLIIAIVSNDDSAAVSATLNEHGFYSTKLATTGGFLRVGNTTLMIGTSDDKVAQAIELIKSECRTRIEAVPTSVNFDMTHFNSYPLEVTVGGATIFVVDVEQFIKV